jgi:hypothetical protein
MALPESAFFSEGRGAALGIKFVLFDGAQEDVEKKCAEARHLGLESMEREINSMKGHPALGDGYELCKKWFDYAWGDGYEVCKKWFDWSRERLWRRILWAMMASRR